MRRADIVLPAPLHAALLFSGSLLIAAFAPAQYFGRQQDDLLYFLAAQALKLGRYDLLTAVGQPPLTSTTPGWPLILAPLASLSDNPGLFQAFATLLLAACPWAFWAWLRPRTGETNALLAALLLASSPLTLSQSGTLMPEAPYLLVFFAALLAAERRRGALAGGLAALLVMVRPAGLSALPALAGEAFVQRRWRDAAASLAAPLAAAGAWSAWSMWRSAGVQEARELALSYGPAADSSPLAVALSNLRFFSAALGGSFLPPSLADGAAATALGAAIMIAASIGVWRALRRRPADPAAIALLGGAAMHLFWT